VTIPFRRAGCVSSLGAAAWAAGSQVPPPRLAAPPAIPVGLLGFRGEVPRAFSSLSISSGSPHSLRHLTLLIAPRHLLTPMGRF
jgi:hypothetical protein